MVGLEIDLDFAAVRFGFELNSQLAVMLFDLDLELALVIFELNFDTDIAKSTAKQRRQAGWRHRGICGCAGFGWSDCVFLWGCTGSRLGGGLDGRNLDRLGLAGLSKLIDEVESSTETTNG
jgi:hypothetical protein